MLYACKWGPCPSTFPSRAAYLKHLNTQHLTDAALDRDAGFVKGRFHEWLRVTGRRGGTQSTVDDSPLRRVENHSDASEAASSPRSPKTAPSRKTARLECFMESSDSEDDLPVSQFKFKAMSIRLNAPESSPTPPIPSVVPSPSPSALASRAQSHIPDLADTPPSPRSPEGVPRRARSHDTANTSQTRKRRRLNAEEDEVLLPDSFGMSHPTPADHPASMSGHDHRMCSPSNQSGSDSSNIIESQLTQDNISLASSEGPSFASDLPGDQSATHGAKDATTNGQASQRPANLPASDNTKIVHDNQPYAVSRPITPSQKDANVEASPGYRPQFTSGILDMSGGNNGQRQLDTSESSSSQTQPESQVSPWRGSHKLAEPSQSSALEASLLPLLTQAPYHYSSQDSQESQI